MPRLAHNGHQVVSLSRGVHRPYRDDAAWAQAEQVIVDRETEDAAGTFPELIRDLKPDVVIDMLCFTLDSARSLVEGLRGPAEHLIHCGSIWMHGPSVTLPMGEADGSEPIGEYGIQKAAIARMLRAETEQGGLVTTSLHPGHISGPGWHIVTPLGNLDPGVWQTPAVYTRENAGQIPPCCI